MKKSLWDFLLFECSRILTANPVGFDQKRVRTLFGEANINGLTVFKWRYSHILIIIKI